MKRFQLTLCLLMAASFLPIVTTTADEGDPVAIRRWPDGGFTVETMWNLHVGISLTEQDKQVIPRTVDFELNALQTDERKLVFRLPNQEKPTTRIYTADRHGPNAIAVSSAGPFIKPAPGQPPDWTGSVEVDGVEITFFNLESVGSIREQLELADDWGVELKPDVIVACNEDFDEALIRAIASGLKPRVLIVNPALKKIGEEIVWHVGYNTLAVSAQVNQDETGTRFVSLGDQPFELSTELAELFSKKEAACRESRELFVKLSIEQMNFRPTNGTHTPRWNTEHMMGRELLFFSQIYHAVDPAIPVMDLNPRQMPDDYEMAHPDWTGAEEARQMERVEAFTRRFAYLLDGLDLDQKAKGSKFWTLRALLKQMERHYGEHTANVRKKIQLDDWPEN